MTHRISDDTLLETLGKYELDIHDALDAAFKLLAEHGEPLTEEQLTVINFAVEVGTRNDSDTWDHEFHGGDRVVRLLEATREDDEDDEDEED